MLKAIAAILLFSFFLQCFQKGIIVVNYLVDKADHARSCENKFRPEINCHGKCVMMKKLAAEENKQQENPELKLENKMEIFQPSANYASLTVHRLYSTRQIPRNCACAPGDWSDDFFHPPCL